jgi:hypothetical protein
MAEFKIPDDEITPIDGSSENTGKYLNNLKKLRAGNGSFNIENGRIELRDSSNNIIVLLDANG